MSDETQRPRFRFRLMTLVFIVAISGLLMVVVNQQAQIARLRQSIEAGQKQKVQLTDMLREMRGHLERQR
jgi:hypothetical protein